MRYIKIASSGALVLIFFYIGILCLIPPISKDALVHHLAIPKLYIDNGGIYEIPSMIFSYYPMNIDILYLISLYFGNDIIPKFIHFSFAILTTFLLFLYIKEKADKGIALIFSALFLSTPIIVKLSITAYVDLGLVFFSITSLLLLFRWIEKDFQVKYLIISAIFCGLAMGTKYNGLLVALLLVLMIPYSYSKCSKENHVSPLKGLSYALLFLLVTTVLFSPWMIRNYAWTKNPIYPLYDGWFQGLRGSEPVEGGEIGPGAVGGSEVGLFAKRRLVYGESGWEIALLPIRVFFEGKDGEPRRFDGRMNPFLLLFPLFAFWGIWRDPLVVRYEKGALLAFAVLYLLIALFTREMRIRYLAPMIPPLVILSAFGLRNIAKSIRAFRGPYQRALGWAIVCGGVVFFVGWNAQYMLSQFRTLEPVGYLVGETSRKEYLERRVPEYPAFQYINTHLPTDSKTLFLFVGNRGYYCDRPYVLDRDYEFYRMVKNASRPEQLAAGLQGKGVTHLLIRYDLFDRWKRDPVIFEDHECSLLNQFMKDHTKTLFIKRKYAVFMLRQDFANPQMNL